MGRLLKAHHTETRQTHWPVSYIYTTKYVCVYHEWKWKRNQSQCLLSILTQNTNAFLAKENRDSLFRCLQS